MLYDDLEGGVEGTGGVSTGRRYISIYLSIRLFVLLYGTNQESTAKQIYT